MLSLVDFQVKLKRRETSNCCQGEIIQKKFKKNNKKKKKQDGVGKFEKVLQLLQEKKKDYIMDSYMKICETLFTSFFRAIVF